MASNRKPLTQIVDTVSPDLEAAGFTRRQLIFVRPAGPSTHHLIEFQANKYVTEPEFTVNLGVYIEGVNEALGWGQTKVDEITEASCQLRERLGVLATGHDVWWSWKDPQTVTAEIRTLLNDKALPLLNQYSSRSAIVALWKRQGTRFWPSRVNPLELAALLSTEGEREAARSVLEQDLAQAEGPRAVGVRKTMQRLGFPVPA